MMMVVIVGSAILLFVCALIARNGSPGAYGSAATAALVFAFLFALIPHPLLMTSALLVCLVGASFAMRPRKSRWFLASPLLVTTLGVAVVCCNDIPYLLEARRLRAEYSLESLAGRLAYEKQRKAGADPNVGGVVPNRVVTADGRTELEWLEDEIGPARHGGLSGEAIDAYDRALTLAEVHSSFVKQFVNSPGFGFGRHVRPDRRLIALPKSPPIALPRRSYDDPGKVDVPKALPLADLAGNADAQLAYFMRDFHRANYLGFINMVGFGYIVDRDHVAGYQAHQFREAPVFSTANEKQQWELEALDLLSMLKHSEPVAYVSNDLPRMDELREAPVRQLDSFESNALAALRRGEDIEVSSSPGRLRMLGSIRAAKQCTRCHDVERGELLGAFSYRLRAVKNH